MRCFAISVSRLRTERVAHGSVFAENSRNCKSSGFTYLQLKGISCYGKVLIEKVSTLTRTLFALWKTAFYNADECKL